MTARDALVALSSGLLALLVSWGVLGMSGSSQRQDISALESRLVERIDKLETRAARLGEDLASCRSQAATPIPGAAAE